VKRPRERSPTRNPTRNDSPPFLSLHSFRSFHSHLRPAADVPVASPQPPLQGVSPPPRLFVADITAAFAVFEAAAVDVPIPGAAQGELRYSVRTLHLALGF
jgi:hypothetical protein